MGDPPQILCTVGGPIDEIGVCLAVYGADLDPSAVSEILGCSPTSSHRRGERRSPKSPPYQMGAWLLEVRGTPPQMAEDLTVALLDRLPSDESRWTRLGEMYDVQLRFGVHMTGWNRGFELSAELAGRIAKLHAKLTFDIYAYEDDPSSSSQSTSLHLVPAPSTSARAEELEGMPVGNDTGGASSRRR